MDRQDSGLTHGELAGVPCAVPQDVSLFVSSTFRDMQDERDALRDVVLPRLREFVRPYGISADFVDLRWGVDTSSVAEKDQDSKVLSVCLAEIDRCEPFFVLLLGDRYGYVPEGSQISVTEQEIDHALAHAPAGRRLLCCLRTIKNRAALSAGQQDIFLDPSHEAQLSALKMRLGKRYPEAVLNYDVEVLSDGTYDLKSFCNCVTEALEARIKDELGEPPTAEHHPLDVERVRQAEHARKLSRFFVGREKALSELKAICSQSEPGVLLVQAEAGAGKTALMARLACELEGGCTVVPAFCDLGQETSDLFGLLRFLIRSLDPEGTQVEDLYRMDYATLCDVFSHAVKKSAQEGPLVILVDALDQLSGAQAGRLGWASFVLPQGCHIVCTTLDGISDEEILHAHARVWGLPGFDEQDARALVSSVCARNHKENLPQSVVDKLIAAAQADGRAINPLWITLVVRHLLMLGRDDYRQIEELQRSQSVSPIDAQAALMSARLDILSRDCEGMYDQLVEDAMHVMGLKEYPEPLLAIAASRWGLRVEDLAGALGAEFDQARFTWLRQLLSEDFVQKEQMKWGFAHQSFRRSVWHGHGRSVLLVNRRKIAPYLVVHACTPKFVLEGYNWPAHDVRTRDLFADHEAMYHLFLADDASGAADLLCLAGVFYGGDQGPRPLGSVFYGSLAEVCEIETQDALEETFLYKVIQQMRGRSQEAWYWFSLTFDRMGLFSVPQMHGYPPEKRVALLEEAIRVATEEAIRITKSVGSVSEPMIAALGELHCEVANVIYQFDNALAPFMQNVREREKYYLEQAEYYSKSCDLKKLALRMGFGVALTPRISLLLGDLYSSLANDLMIREKSYDSSLYQQALRHFERYLDFTRAEEGYVEEIHQLDLVTGLAAILRTKIRLGQFDGAGQTNSDLLDALRAIDESSLDAFGCKVVEAAWIASSEYWRARMKNVDALVTAERALRVGLRSFVLWPQYADRIQTLRRVINEIYPFNNVQLRDEERRALDRLYMECREDMAAQRVSISGGTTRLFVRIGLSEPVVRQAYLDERMVVLKIENVKERRDRLDSLNACYAAYEETQGNYDRSDEVLAKMERALKSRLSSPEGSVINNRIVWERRLQQIRSVKPARDQALECGAFEEPLGLEKMSEHDLVQRASALRGMVGVYSDLLGEYGFVEERATGLNRRYLAYSRELRKRGSLLFEPMAHAGACLMVAGNLRTATALSGEFDARIAGETMLPKDYNKGMQEVIAYCAEADDVLSHAKDSPAKYRLHAQVLSFSGDVIRDVLSGKMADGVEVGEPSRHIDDMGKDMDLRSVCADFYLPAYKQLSKLSSSAQSESDVALEIDVALAEELKRKINETCPQ